MKIKTNPLSVKKIEEIATKVREHFNISLDTYFPIIEIVEELSNNGTFSLSIDSDSSFADNVYALYYPETNIMSLRESVYNECYEDVYRSNFTVAHELFHFMQAKILNFSFEEVEECESYEDIEWQANEFAAQLLIPSIALSLDTLEIVKTYHVSEEAVLVRKNKILTRNNKIT